MPVDLPVFQRHSTCTKCELHQSAQHVGIPTRPADGVSEVRHPACVLFVGKMPGVEEDKRGECHTGSSGRIYMHKLYIGGSKVSEFADCYVTNALRCKPSHPDASVTPFVKVCKEYLHADIAQLKAAYRTVVVVACGDEALQACGFTCGLKGFQQGITVSGVTYFATFNPALFLPKRNPSKAMGALDHLNLVYEFLKYGTLRMSLQIEAADRTSEPPTDGVVSLDIETYGAVEPQTQFHPVKMATYDGKAGTSLILTAAAAWEGGHRVWNLQDESPWDPSNEVHKFMRWMESFQGTLLFHNATFDLSVLRSWWCGRLSMRMPRCLTPFVGRIEDTMVWAFLENDERQERSLKALSLLTQIYNYAAELSLKREERYESSADPRLHRYNAIDAVGTFLLRGILRDRISRRYGSNSEKLSDYCSEWFSDKIWLCLQFIENGCHLDVAGLAAEQLRLDYRAERVVAFGKLRYDATYSGVGSQKYSNDLAARSAATLNLTNDKRLVISKITKKISTCEENLQLFMDECDSRSELGRELSALLQFRKLSKLVSSYTSKLTATDYPDYTDTERARAIKSWPIDNIVYPQWFPTPSQNEDSDEGGTRQGRFAASNPSLPTQPRRIKQYWCSRFGDGGCILRADSSQLELRIIAMAANDEPFLEVFRNGGNPHESTASVCFGRRITKRDAAEYHLGKTVNFLVVYGGGVDKLLSTAQKVGLILSRAQAQELLVNFNRGHPAIRDYQARNLAYVKRHKHLGVPLCGLSRTFAASTKGVEASYMSEICNFPVQAIASLGIQSAQVEVCKWVQDNAVQALAISNTYDEMCFDLKSDYLEPLEAKVRAAMREPPYIQHLVEIGYLQPLPLDCDVKVI